jgi:NitT/TauT family transport system substrate-binding protein
VDVNGGDSATLKFVEMPLSQMPSAFASGRIDVASIGEPYLTDARKVAHPLGASEDAIGQHFMVSAWFAMGPWCTAHPDLVRRFAAAIRDTDVWANKNPRACAEIMARDYHTDPAAIAPNLMATFASGLEPQLIQPMIDVVARYAKFPPFPAQDIIFSAT